MGAVAPTRVGFVCLHGVSSRGPAAFFARFLDQNGLANRFEVRNLGIVFPDYLSEVRLCGALVSFEGIEAIGRRVFLAENGRLPAVPLVLNPFPKRVAVFVFSRDAFYGCLFDPRSVVVPFL